jgi:hypothetical protein
MLLYHSTKVALERLPDALHYELGSFGVRLKADRAGRQESRLRGRSIEKPRVSGVFE